MQRWSQTNFASALIRRPKDGWHTKQPKPAKLNAGSKFARKNTKKQMSWVKLCESEKSWQTYHTEELSLTHFESRKPDLANQNVATSQKLMRLKN